MLATLHIENIAVAKSVDIDFSQGFTVFTGETGAGKSIIVDSIALITGGRFKAEMLRTGEKGAMVSAYVSDISPENLSELSSLGVSTDEDGGIYVQRNFHSDGKSQTRLNGRQVPIALLRSVMTLLVNIHGQHDNQKLLDPESHVSLLDAWAENEVLLADYTDIYSQIREVERKISEATVDESEKIRTTELLKYQIDDIFSMNLKPDEEEELEARRNVLRNLEKTRKHTQLIYRALFRNEKGASASTLIDMSTKSIEAIADIMPGADEFISKLDMMQSELEEIAEQAMMLTEGTSGNPEADLDKIETRLNKIKKLEKKYGPTLEDVLAYGEEIKQKLDALDSSDVIIKELNRDLKALKEKAAEIASSLHNKRCNAASELERLICDQLAFLDMKSAVFKADIKYDPEMFTLYGSDEVEFLLSANQGEEPRPMALIASGGELARIMLGIKSVFAEKEGTQTLIYDEIDTGISGKTAQKLGLVLKKCAESAQVLCITHSAQIAAAADHHMLVAKGVTDGRVQSGVREISGEERISEIARIMGGNNITDKLRASARDLINETLV